MLYNRRTEMIVSAAQKLNASHMARFSFVAKRNLSSVRPEAPMGVTDLGRVASHFYISYETVETFNEALTHGMSDSELMMLVCKAQEFEQVKCRDDEMEELTKMCGGRGCCVLGIKGSLDRSETKSSVLLQAYIGRYAMIRNFTLISDMNYVAQNGGESRAHFLKYA